MMVTRLLPVDARRWAIAATCLVVWLALGQLCLKATSQDALLGLRASEQQAKLVISWVQPAGSAWDAGIRRGAVVTDINGRAVTPPTSPAAVAGATSVRVRSQTGRMIPASVDAARSVSNGRRFSFLVLAAWFMAVGVAIFLLGMDLITGYIILGLSLSSAVALVAGIATPFGASWTLAIEHVAVISFAASVFLLFLAFPVNHLTRRWGRAAAACCLGVSAVLVGLYAWVVIFDPAAFEWLLPTELALMGVDFIAAGVVAISALVQKSAHQTARPALAIVALGMLAGLAPFYLLIIVPPLFDIKPLATVDSAVISIVLIPIGLGTAVLGWQFSDITRLARRSFVALTVWAALLSVYALGLSLFYHAVIGPNWHLSVLPWSVLAVLLIASTFPPAQYYLRCLLERFLFHDVYDYAAALEQLSNEIVHLHGVEAIATHILRRLMQLLDLRWAAITLGSSEEPQAQYCCGDRAPHALPASASHEALTANISAEGSDPTQLFIPLTSESEFVGTLAVGPKRHDTELLHDDRLLIATVAPLVGTALQNALLTRSLERQVAALAEREHELAALTTRLMEVQEDERRRIALDVHDDPLQRAILLKREMSDVSSCPQCLRSRQGVEEIGFSLRAICAGLRPPMLDDLGLIPALEWLVSDLSARSELAASLIVECESPIAFGRLQADLEVALYRIAQEALTNCLKHAYANQVWVVLGRDERRVWLRIADDGKGILSNAAPASTPDSSPHLGLLGMRERVRPWNGRVSVESAARGGTRVVTEVALRGTDEHIQPTMAYQSAHR